MTNPAETATTSPGTNYDAAPFGSFPIIDRELVRDYSKPVTDPERQFFRIHMDIPIKSEEKFDELLKALNEGNEGEVYADIKSTLPLEDPDNKRAHTMVDAALKPAEPARRPVALGSFPIIDRQLVTDYARSATDPQRQFFRIHMDIPITNDNKFEHIRRALNEGKDRIVYADIKSALPTVNPDNERAHAVVDAALKTEEM